MSAEWVLSMTDKKSICLVSAQYLPHIGGVENFVFNLSKQLEKNGHEVTIITSRLKGTPEYEKNGSIEIYRLPSRIFINGKFPVLKHGKALRTFTKDFRNRKFDIMLINVRFYFLSLWAAKLAKKMGVRAVILDHGSSHIDMGSRFATKVGELYEHFITAREKAYCKEFAGVSRAVTEWLSHFGVKTDRVLYNAINAERFTEMKNNPVRDFRAEFGIPEGSLVVSFIGRFISDKGIFQLNDAMKLICNERQDIHLIMAGDGEEMSAFREVVFENVHLTGAISSAEVAAMLSSSDIFCLPSVSEGFPTVVLEGGICENYVICSSGGGGKEVITDSDYGCVLPENTPEEIAKAILYAANNPEYRLSAAKRCHDRIIERHTWETTARALTELADSEYQSNVK